MTRSWARTSALLPGNWHYFPLGVPTTRADSLPAAAACGGYIDGGDCQELVDQPDREIPAPACWTCWYARQAVEAYRRSLKHDPVLVRRAANLRAALDEIAADASCLVSELRRAEEMAVAVVEGFKIVEAAP